STGFVILLSLLPQVLAVTVITVASLSYVFLAIPPESLQSARNGRPGCRDNRLFSRTPVHITGA
ncbi:MAG: hypothetical protein WBF96_02285, partial [Phycisphaerae bacterium]